MASLCQYEKVPDHSQTILVTKELASDNQTGTYTVQQAFFRSPKQLKCATQRRLLTIKCPVELSQGLQSVQSVLGQSGGPALGIPPRRLSSTSDSLFASLTVQASQWAPLLIGCTSYLPRGLSLTIPHGQIYHF